MRQQSPDNDSPHQLTGPPRRRFPAAEVLFREPLPELAKVIALRGRESGNLGGNHRSGNNVQTRRSVARIQLPSLLVVGESTLRLARAIPSGYAPASAVGRRHLEGVGPSAPTFLSP